MRDRRQRPLGDGRGQACLPSEQLVQSAEKRAASDKDEAAVGDVREELRRCTLEQLVHGGDDPRERPRDRIAHLVGADLGPAYEPGAAVAAADFG
jgi:hypothetical protein